MATDTERRCPVCINPVLDPDDETCCLACACEWAIYELAQKGTPVDVAMRERPTLRVVS